MTALIAGTLVFNCCLLIIAVVGWQLWWGHDAAAD